MILLFILMQGGAKQDGGGMGGYVTSMFVLVMKSHAHLRVSLMRTDDAMQRSRVSSLAMNTPKTSTQYVHALQDNRKLEVASCDVTHATCLRRLNLVAVL